MQPPSNTSIQLSPHCGISFQRTLRIPDDGSDYPLPPSLGSMDVYRAADDEYGVPIWPNEALWLHSDGPYWKPHALKLGLGAVDAISGGEFHPDALSAEPQDYVVIPDQPWLDGINSGEGTVKQFVAVPLGSGLSVESQLVDGEGQGTLSFVLFDPLPGLFPDEPPHEEPISEVCACEDAMALGAGGSIRQEIYEDSYGLATWDKDPAAVARVDLVDAHVFAAITGLDVPQVRVDAATYTQFGLPWFDLIDPLAQDIAAAEALRGVRTVDDLLRIEGESLPVSEGQVVRLLRVRDHLRAAV